MLIEQQLTENIEIDDEPVEQNTAHSLFFDTYYKSLTDIELVNRQLLDAQEQFRWYTSKLDEVDRLADEAEIPNYSSTISVTDLPQVIKLECSSYEKDFKLFLNKIDQLGETNERQNEEIKALEENIVQLNILDSQLISEINKREKTERTICTTRNHIKKNTQFLFAIIPIASLIIIAFVSSIFINWLAIPLAIMPISLVLKKLDLL